MPRMAIRRLAVGAVLVLGFLLAGSAGQRHGGFPKPPEPAVPEDKSAPPALKRIHLDIVTMEREANEMAVLASSTPYDIEQLKKGLLPSDAVDKLKRIEKLAKQLRAQIHP